MKNHGLGILAGALWAALILVPLTAGASTEWLEPVDQQVFAALEK